MSKSLDQLARNLASGMSRRKALWQFVAGLGVVTALTGKKAYARSPWCAGFCAAQAEFFYAMCLDASSKCGPGSCAEFSLIGFNGTIPIGVAVNSSTTIKGGPFCCVPVGFNGSPV